MKCLLCTEAAATFWQDKCTTSGIYGIWRCSSCRSAFVWPRPDNRVLAALYASPSYGARTRHDADSTDVEYYPTSWRDADIIIKRCASLAKGQSLLDVGAGNGTFSSVAMKHGFDVDAVEPSQNARAVFCEVNGFSPQETLFDRSFAQQRTSSYDVVLLSQVLEHMPDPLETVRNICTVLRPGGVAAIAVPHFGSLLSVLQGTNDMFISPPEHLNFFSERGLTKLFMNNHFKAPLVETVSKAPRRRIERLARFRSLGSIGWRAVYTAMRLSDWLNIGTFLNAYFEKSAR